MTVQRNGGLRACDWKKWTFFMGKAKAGKGLGIMIKFQESNPIRSCIW